MAIGICKKCNSKLELTQIGPGYAMPTHCSGGYVCNTHPTNYNDYDFEDKINKIVGTHVHILGKDQKIMMSGRLVGIHNGDFEIARPFEMSLIKDVLGNSIYIDR